MINIMRYGSTAENNSWVLPEGMFSQDVEKMSVRVHDGVTPGGFEAIGVRAYDPPNTGPGPKELIAGTMDAGFFGETTSEELFTYEELATQIGLSAGTSQHNEGSLWLKFALEGEILYVAKKTARHSLSWNHINNANVVFEGGTQVTVGSHTFDVTLLRGANSDPTVQGADGLWFGYDADNSHGSEWNRLMYPIHSGVHIQSDNPSVHGDPTADPFGSWANYSDSDLLVHRDVGNGSYSWCQEVSGRTATDRLHRGLYGVTFISQHSSAEILQHIGWRPCLRLVV